MSKNQRLAFLSAITSSFCFAFMSFAVKLLAEQGQSPSNLVFGRFLVGFIFICLLLTVKKHLPRPVKMRFILLRAFSNIAAVFLFYWTIKLTDITKANLLNMTYPIFIGMLSPLLLKEYVSKKQWLFILLALFGVYLIFGNSGSSFELADMIGILCGFISALTVMSLRVTRRYDSSLTIVFYLMLLGNICLAPFVDWGTAITGSQIYLYLAAGVFALAGQLSLTYAFKALSAVEGSITSTLRVFITGCIGYFWFQQSYGLKFFTGSALILLGIYGIHKFKDLKYYPNQKKIVDSR